jgi:hypothetical protein
MAKLTLDIPDKLLLQLEAIGQPLQLVMLRALEQYVHAIEQEFSLTQTQTWQLSGSFKVLQPEEEWIEQDERGEIVTNYAEHVDNILY